ncbi:hypothetical protein SAMN04487911_10327 [Arenibacter nanhaiticus]|uniref:Uncharacterized protein n=1 Tax=Arenibacter nanhaiticus TaxID=558155 RepID=A0A1M6BZ18_9FLAO|nr:hypothetical protein [Arenibacter nanhaiticus]SHI53990.1 hypothetical protein SAMN04487911_10327 [Arenibacter nanhaiticus]
MKKISKSIVLLLLATAPSFAQIGGIEDSVNDVSDTIRTIFPIILGVIFIIGFLFNAGHFFGENADLKKRKTYYRKKNLEGLICHTRGGSWDGYSGNECFSFHGATAIFGVPITWFNLL